MRTLALLAIVCGCSAPAAQYTPTTVVLRNARLPGGARVELLIRDGRIAAIGDRVARGGRQRDLGGRFVAPQVIDSHVHLAYWPVAKKLSAAGIAGAVDLAAPIDRFDRSALRIARSGPMITAVAGYPTRSWGRGGYGLEVAGPGEARRAVAAVVDRGAQVIKVALGPGGLGRSSLEAVVAAARAAGVPVAAHALSAEAFELAAEAGVDILAHVPVEPIDARRWRGRHVITTLSAFDPAAASANLERLIAAGAIPIYGTDLGNTRELGISRAEIAAMIAAGMSPAQILESMTAAPARLWGWSDLGALEVGRQARLLVLDRDPLEEPSALAAPVEVIGGGATLRRRVDAGLRARLRRGGDDHLRGDGPHPRAADSR